MYNVLVLVTDKYHKDVISLYDSVNCFSDSYNKDLVIVVIICQ